MARQLHRLVVTVLQSALVGGVAGAVVAAREVSAHHYLGQQLWRTTLWIAAQDTLAGSLLGGAGGAVILLSLAIWRALVAAARSSREKNSPRPHARAMPGPESRLTAVLAVCAGAAVLLIPMEGGRTYDVAGWLPVAAFVALLWAIAFDSLAGTPEARERGEGLSRLDLFWSQIVSLTCIVGLGYLWHREWADWVIACLAAVGIVVVVVAYRTLYRPFRSLVDWLSAALPAAIQRRLHLAPVLMMGCLAALWATGWLISQGTRGRAAAAGTNVIVIAVDTLRWDAVSLLSADEHDRDLTPNLRELLTPRATLFRKAYSQAPWTLPAFASVFTGLYPEQHGAQHIQSRLLPQQMTLAEVLREHGYLTMSVVSGYYVTSNVGLMQGFTLRDESQALGPAAVTSHAVTDRALELLAAHREQPFFLFVHYFDPHYQYNDHAEFNFASPGARSLLAHGSARKAFFGGFRGTRLGPDDYAEFRALYDEEVAYVDLQIGRLLAFLGEAGLWDSTWVVFVGDHGEEFLDHGSAGHEHTVFEELIRVPLLVADPSRSRHSIIDGPVEIRWLFPTLLRVLGIRSPADPAPSHDLFASRQDDDYRVRSSTRPSPIVGARWLSCLVEPRYKLIRDHVRDEVTVFDLVDDPKETKDIGADRPDLAGRLLPLLQAWDAEVSEAGPAASMPPLDAEQLRRLEDLGYL